MGTMVRTSALAVYALYEGFFRRFGSGGGALQYHVLRVTPPVAATLRSLVPDPSKEQTTT